MLATEARYRGPLPRPATEGENALGRATRMAHETYAALGILGILLLGNSASRIFNLALCS
jgi:hypothetical protein